MLEVSLAKWLRVAAAGLTVLAFTPATTLAAGDDPPPKPSSTQGKPKPKSKTKTKSKDKDSRLNQDEIYSLGYWQAKRGEYAAALATLRSAPDAADPRIETMIGFSLRKLGRVEEGMVYYQRVLAAHPERTTTRQYLGEAFLQIGDPDKAKEQLAEIGKRCGVACEDYQLLADEIAKFENAAG
jgi:tetratricopeptide (TPR) repeat protein